MAAPRWRAGERLDPGPAAKAGRRQLPLRVRTIGGSEYEIRPGPYWTVYDLKFELNFRTLVPAGQQRLLHGPRVLQNDEPLHSILPTGAEELLEAFEITLIVQAQNADTVELLASRVVVREAVKYHGLVLQHATAELRGNREIVVEAIHRHGGALRFATAELRGDREIVMEAVKRDGTALCFAAEELKGDEGLVLEAIKQNARAARWASAELLGTKSFARELGRRMSSDALEQVSEALAGRDDLQELLERKVLRVRRAK